MSRSFLSAGIALGVALALSGCGVKSAPAEVDGGTYPRTYPAEPAEAKRTAPRVRTGTVGTAVDTRRPRYDSSGTYNPPPPATELLVK
ncbi:MAG: hypothetical protein JJ900_00600 [Rhodospirillales bacterium]|nr:hypothetical protein [Rhodospirillales bacterium]MBO6785316.1 hypothetical protein [Rhodospirillales bacterium]